MIRRGMRFCYLAALSLLISASFWEVQSHAEESLLDLSQVSHLPPLEIPAPIHQNYPPLDHPDLFLFFQSYDSSSQALPPAIPKDDFSKWWNDQMTLQSFQLAFLRMQLSNHKRADPILIALPHVSLSFPSSTQAPQKLWVWNKKRERVFPAHSDLDGDGIQNVFDSYPFIPSLPQKGGLHENAIPNHLIWKEGFTEFKDPSSEMIRIQQELYENWKVIAVHQGGVFRKNTLKIFQSVMEHIFAPLWEETSTRPIHVLGAVPDDRLSSPTMNQTVWYDPIQKSLGVTDSAQRLKDFRIPIFDREKFNLVREQIEIESTQGREIPGKSLARPVVFPFNHPFFSRTYAHFIQAIGAAFYDQGDWKALPPPSESFSFSRHLDIPELSNDPRERFGYEVQLVVYRSNLESLSTQLEEAIFNELLEHVSRITGLNLDLLSPEFQLPLEFRKRDRLIRKMLQLAPLSFSEEDS